MQLKQDLKNGKSINSKMNAMVKQKLNGVNMSALKISPLKIGFFNAIVNDKFDKNERIDLVSIFNKKPHGRKSIPRTSLDIEIKSIKLYHGQFKVAAEHSLSGKFGDQTKKNFMVQIAAHVYDGNANQGITFRVYRNGKIHFSGGILNNNIKQPEQIRKYIVDTFTNRETFLYSPIIFNNTAGQFDVNGALNLSGIARAFRMSGKIDYEPELRAALRMDYMGSSFQMFTTGIVQILGARSEQEMLQAYEYGKDLVTQLYVMKLMTISNKPSKKAKVKTNINDIPLAQLYPEAVKKKAPKNNTVGYNDKKNAVKIGKRACTRLPKPELVAVAKRIGVVDIKATTSKEKICDKIKARVFGNYKVNKKPCLSYTKAQLMPLAVAKGISVTDKDTVQTLCEKLKVGPPKVAKKVVKKEAATAALMAKRRLTNNTIRKNLETLYGKKWLDTYRNVMPSLNENVAEIKRRVEALNVKKNKKGIPFKKNVNAIKKSSVRGWKFQRKKMLNNKLNALNNNLANELENLMNVEIVQKKSPKKKFPKGTKVEQL
jgi:TATA-box binding protein (TBP) (component of TFIID and TFIIIB)